MWFWLVQKKRKEKYSIQRTEVDEKLQNKSEAPWNKLGPSWSLETFLFTTMKDLLRLEYCGQSVADQQQQFNSVAAMNFKHLTNWGA